MRVALIAPSFPVPQEDVDVTKQYLKDLGMDVVVPSDILGKDLLCANVDEKRFAFLRDALTDPSIDIVWLLRGGYGLTRLLPALLSLKKPEKEKLFIGFSDGTALHLFLNHCWSWVSLHGPGAIQLSRKKVKPQTIEATLHLVNEGLGSSHIPPLKPLNQSAKKITSLTGTVIGGNLCLLTCSLGTKYQPTTADKILFLEDVDERGYRVDRMLMQLQQAALFDEVKAIILGDFIGGNEADGTTLIPAVLKRFAETTPIPVFSLPGCGHGEENIPLPLNLNLTFSVAR